MLLAHLLLHLVQRLGGYSDERSMRQHDRQVERMAVRRRIAHADVPSLEVVEEHHGKHFQELVEMLVAADPARLHSRKSRKGNDHEQVDMMRRRYRLLAWTLIHRLAAPDAVERTEAILAKEFSLWFSGSWDPDPSDPEDLVPQVARWRSRWDFR